MKGGVTEKDFARIEKVRARIAVGPPATKKRAGSVEVKPSIFENKLIKD